RLVRGVGAFSGWLRAGDGGTGASPHDPAQTPDPDAQRPPPPVRGAAANGRGGADPITDGRGQKAFPFLAPAKPADASPRKAASAETGSPNSAPAQDSPAAEVSASGARAD